MAFTPPLPLIAPFCSAGTPGTDYIIPPLSSVDPDVMTQQVGYPVSQATAFNAGGVPVTRPQTNGALNLYSSHIVWTNVGGQYTFEISAVFMGGYNAGAVLFDFPTNRYVVSLIDNNVADFVTDPSNIDGVNWQWLDVFGYASDAQTITGTSAVLGVTPHGLMASIVNYTATSSGAGYFSIPLNSGPNAGTNLGIGTLSGSGSVGSTGNSTTVTVVFPFTTLSGAEVLVTSQGAPGNVFITNVLSQSTSLAVVQVYWLAGSSGAFTLGGTVIGLI